MSDVASPAPEAVAPVAAPPVAPPPQEPVKPAAPAVPALDPQLLEDLKAQLAEAAKRELDLLKKNVALKFKLPEPLARRLVGKTEAELEADAQALVPLVAPPPAPAPANLPPTPASGAPAPKTMSDDEVERVFLKARKSAYSL